MAPQPDSGAPKIGTQATAMITGSFMSGAMMGLSIIVIPVFLETDIDPNPTHLLRQWVRLYHYGHLYLPAVCIATCGLYGYTALSKRASSRKQWLMYTVAGATTITMIPFTWYMMAPTNNTLFRLEAEATASASASVADLSAVEELVVRWACLHVVRSMFPLVGAILGLTGIQQELGL